MGAVQTRLVKLGLATQSAFGTAATAPTYIVGLTGGKIYDVELEEAELDTTWDNRVLSGYDRHQAVPVSDSSVVAMPQSIGTFLMCTLGAHAVTGVGPYTHTFTVGSALPYATLWGMFGSADSAQITDAKLDSLELAWEKTAALSAKAKFMGCGINIGTAFPGTGTSETVSGGVLKGAGGVFSANGVSARVVGGSLKFTNTLEAIVASSSIVPLDMFEGRLAIECSLKIKPTDLTEWRRVVTGTTSGTVISANVLQGAVDLKFLGPSGSSLEFTSSTVAWSSSMPDANPGGGAAELTLTGRFVIPSGGGSPITATLINSVATY